MHNTTQKTLVTTAAMAAMLFGLAACDNAAENPEDGATGEAAAPESPGAAGEQGGEEGQPEEGGQPGEMPSPDLEDVPEVVAEVNGEEIPGDDFRQAYESQYTQMAMQAQMTGEEVDEEGLQDQTVENLVNLELLAQDAEASGYEATEEDVDAELENVAEQNGIESVDELLSVAEEQGTSEEQLRADVEQQVLINQVIDDLDVAEPTEEEIEEAYEEVAAQQPPAEGEDGEEAETPSLEELRPQIEEQLAAEKENEAAMAHVEELRESAEIEVHI